MNNSQLHVLNPSAQHGMTITNSLPFILKQSGKNIFISPRLPLKHLYKIIGSSIFQKCCIKRPQLTHMSFHCFLKSLHAVTSDSWPLLPWNLFFIQLSCNKHSLVCYSLAEIFDLSEAVNDCVWSKSNYVLSM